MDGIGKSTRLCKFQNFTRFYLFYDTNSFGRNQKIIQPENQKNKTLKCFFRTKPHLYSRRFRKTFLTKPSVEQQNNTRLMDRANIVGHRTIVY